MSLNPDCTALRRGDSAQIVGTLTRIGNFDGDVATEFEPVPVGVSPVVRSGPIHGGLPAQMAIVIGPTAAAGTYSLQVVGIGSVINIVKTPFKVTVTN